jgi:DNA invertase Pin-like site-specific DNA recombinase
MPLAVIYTRVSTDEQAKTGQSLESQQKACSEFARRAGYEVVEVFREEGASAKSTDRKVLLQMLNYCGNKKNGIEALIVWKVDRFARKAEDHHMLKAYLNKVGVRLLSVTEPIEDSSTGRLMESVLAGFAQFDNDVRTERTVNGLRARAEQGGWTTYAPLGYKNSRDSLGRPTLTPDPETAPLVGKIFERYATGFYTQEEMRDYSEVLGLRARKSGGRVVTQTIANMLRNPAYMGYRTKPGDKSELIRALHQPLISKELFERAQDILGGRFKSVRESKEGNWPLRAGFMKCAECHTPVTGSSPKGRTKYYPKYSCPSCRASAIGKPVSVDRATVHAQFEGLLSAIKPKEGHAKLFKAIVLRRWNDEYREASQDKIRVENDLAKLQAKRQKVMDLFIDSKLSEADKDDQIKRVDAERVSLRARLSELQEDADDKEVIIDVAIDFMSNVSKYWAQAPIELQRRFQSLVFPDGIEYEFGVGFRTAKMGSSYEVVSEIVADKSNVVGMAWSNWNQLRQYLVEVNRVMKADHLSGLAGFVRT